MHNFITLPFLYFFFIHKCYKKSITLLQIYIDVDISHLEFLLAISLTIISLKLTTSSIIVVLQLVNSLIVSL